jgi:hypothetical protein
LYFVSIWCLAIRAYVTRESCQCLCAFRAPASVTTLGILKLLRTLCTVAQVLTVGKRSQVQSELGEERGETNVNE